MKEILFAVGGCVVGALGALGFGWYKLAKDMEKWW